MAKPKLPNQKKAYKSLEKRLIQYVASVRAIYEELNKEASQIALRTDYDPTGEKPFRWADFPQTTKAIKSLQSSFVQKMETLIISGISAEWMASNRFCDLLADKVMKAYGAKGKKKYYQVNNDAKKAFIARKDRGMNLSQKLWNQSAEYKAGLEHTLSVAIEKGMSAVTLSKRVSKYLNDFDTMKADYGKRFGKATNIYDCEYRSVRLARSEINMAYRNAEQLRWSQMDFIIGYEVKLSDNHNCKGVPNGAFYDICDDLKGRYPKDFKWSGWHPNCYDAKSMVMTAEGWKYFQDVSDDDLILSLNPATRQTEWVGITDRQVYAYDGEMMHFKSKVLDCLVTPDHPMVYVNKSDGELRICPAKEYTQGKGGFYRKEGVVSCFKKQKTHYNGFVYDLTLERNHIMYVSRNGKCFWGSNCRCYVIAIIKSEERFWEDEDKRGNDNETITEMPENFNKWASLNQDRIARAEQRGTLPYFVRDNRERVKQAIKKGDVVKE